MNLRRYYLPKKKKKEQPCQPHEHDFPQTKIGGLMHRFNPKWFKEYGSWLEYSIEMMLHIIYIVTYSIEIYVSY